MCLGCDRPDLEETVLLLISHGGRLWFKSAAWLLTCCCFQVFTTFLRILEYKTNFLKRHHQFIFNPKKKNHRQFGTSGLQVLFLSF